MVGEGLDLVSSRQIIEYLDELILNIGVNGVGNSRGRSGFRLMLSLKMPGDFFPSSRFLMSRFPGMAVLVVVVGGSGYRWSRRGEC